ncbi:MAG: hypothetical protein E6R13_02115 [Spirochaetes bacterium]|nr:MAG: hypothetical protein E6R13_02115 [Spirochaetota bacterium]
MANINDYIGKYGSALADSDAYRNRVELDTGKPYTLTPQESQKILDYWNKKRNSTTSTIGEKVSSAVTTTGDFIGKLVATQEQQGSMTNEMLKASDLTKDLFTLISNLGSPAELIGGIFKGLANQASIYLSQQTELLGVINTGARITGQMSQDIREELTEANIPLVRLGIGFDELSKASRGLVENSGRFITLNRDSWYEAGAVASAYVGTLSEMVNMFPEFEKVGYGAGDVASKIEDIGKSSLNLGLQSSKITNEVKNNINKLNEYGFENGIKGLTTMVQKSVEFRMNMGNVFSIAEKALSPESAIELSANLSVLGGAIGDFADPLKMMYDATNNVEGLQDALIGAAGSLATYNAEQGRFEVTGANLRRAREMASALGMSLSELSNISISAAERASVAADLMASGLKLNEEQERFITNISSMKEGKMTIELNSDRMKDLLGVDRNTREIALENLTQKQVNAILNYQDDFKKLSKEEIVQKQATEVENIARDVNFIAAIARVEAAKKGKGFIKDIEKELGVDTGIFKKLSNEYGDKAAKNFGYRTLNQPTTVKVNQKSLETVQVNNKPKKEEINNNTSSEDIANKVKTGVIEAINATKYGTKQNITVQADLQPENPNSYLSYQIGGR